MIRGTPSRKAAQRHAGRNEIRLVDCEIIAPLIAAPAHRGDPPGPIRPEALDDVAAIGSRCAARRAHGRLAARGSLPMLKPIGASAAAVIAAADHVAHHDYARKERVERSSSGNR